MRGRQRKSKEGKKGQSNKNSRHRQERIIAHGLGERSIHSTLAVAAVALLVRDSIAHEILIVIYSPLNVFSEDFLSFVSFRIQVLSTTCSKCLQYSSTSSPPLSLLLARQSACFYGQPISAFEQLRALMIFQAIG